MLVRVSTRFELSAVDCICPTRLVGVWLKSFTEKSRSIFFGKSGNKRFLKTSDVLKTKMLVTKVYFVIFSLKMMSQNGHLK